MATQGPAYDFQAYAAGNKIYGLGRSSPNNGFVDLLGYKERDAATRLKRNAMLRRMKAGLAGNYMSSDWLGGPNS